MTIFWRGPGLSLHHPSNVVPIMAIISSTLIGVEGCRRHKCNKWTHVINVPSIITFGPKRSKSPIRNNLLNSSVITVLSVTAFGPKCNKGRICKSYLYTQTGNIPTNNIMANERKPTPAIWFYMFMVSTSLSNWILHLVVWLEKY